MITYRPEYRGALARVSGAQTIALAPLSDAETTGADFGTARRRTHRCGRWDQTIAERAAGTPFFAEEIVRDLAERGVLHGKPRRIHLDGDVAEVSVPATVQATIAARIDRLDPGPKRTLSAAAVIGATFSPDLLNALGVDAVR